MKALDLIQNDLERAQPGSLRWLLIPALLSLAMAVIGLGMRRDFAETFTAANLLPAALILVCLAASIGSLAGVGQHTRLVYPLAALALALSLIQPHTPVSLAKFAPPGSFWPETLHCLVLGLASSAVASLLLTGLVFRLLPTPGRGAQRACAAVSGLYGLAALSLHCMGPLASHTLIGHWGQALLIFPLAFVGQRAAFAYRMRRVLGQSGNLRGWSRLGD